MAGKPAPPSGGDRSSRKRERIAWTIAQMEQGVPLVRLYRIVADHFDVGNRQSRRYVKAAVEAQQARYAELDPYAQTDAVSKYHANEFLAEKTAEKIEADMVACEDPGQRAKLYELMLKARKEARANRDSISRLHGLFKDRVVHSGSVGHLPDEWDESKLTREELETLVALGEKAAKPRTG